MSRSHTKRSWETRSLELDRAVLISLVHFLGTRRVEFVHGKGRFVLSGIS